LTSRLPGNGRVWECTPGDARLGAGPPGARDRVSHAGTAQELHCRKFGSDAGYRALVKIRAKENRSSDTNGRHHLFDVLQPYFA